MDNLPNDPSNPNNGNNPPASPDASQGGPPPFGSSFNPHTNPVDPNNPYPSTIPTPPTTPTTPIQPPTPNPPNTSENPDLSHPSIHSEVAKHRPRDSHGHFLPYEHPVSSPPQTSPTSQTPPNPSTPTNPSNLPPLIETNPKTYTPDPDPPIVTVRNPITYIKKWWNKILAKEGIDFKLGFRIKPVTAVLIASIVISGGVSSGVTAIVLKTFWPTSSPILHRQIIQQGTIQTGTGGFYLSSSDSSIWKLKAKNPNINFHDQVGKSVTITGNMTKESGLIEVSEIILFESGSSVPKN